MVVSSTSNISRKAILEIASRKLHQLSHKNLEYKKFSEQLSRYAAALGSNPKVCAVKPTIALGDTTSMDSCCSRSCIFEGVLDILARRNDLFSFKEACAILAHGDVDKYRTTIEKTIRKYGIVIIGLPECTEDDLLLAVYFFVEDMFGIQPNIELCRKITEEGETDMVGVLFDNIVTKQKIVDKLDILEDSGIEIDTYFEIDWVVDGFSF